MAEFRSSSDKYTEATNMVIAGFHSSLQSENEALSLVRSEIKVENAKLTSSVLSNIEKLQEDLVVENKIMDQLVEKTQKAKVISFKLRTPINHIDDLQNERTVIKSCIYDINQYLMRLVETRESLFTVSVQQQLSDKL